MEVGAGGGLGRRGRYCLVRVGLGQLKCSSSLPTHKATHRHHTVGQGGLLQQNLGSLCHCGLTQAGTKRIHLPLPTPQRAKLQLSSHSWPEAEASSPLAGGSSLPDAASFSSSLFPLPQVRNKPGRPTNISAYFLTLPSC